MRPPRRSLLVVAVAIVLGGASLVPAHADEVKHHPTMLYAVSGSEFSLSSADGQTGLLTVSDPDEVLQFTDRPDHWSDRIPASSMLQVLGLTGRPLDVQGMAPNAVLALTGRRTLPLEITHGSLAKDGSLRLRVARLGPKLPTVAGTGSLFVDSVAPVQVSLVGRNGVQWGSLDVYWEGSHWSVVPYFDGTEEAKARFYRKDFFAASDPTFPIAQAFWNDDFSTYFSLENGDLTRLHIAGALGEVVIDANAPGGPACSASPCQVLTPFNGSLDNSGDAF